MGLKAILESLDAVPEVLREHYTQSQDGKFRLSAEGMVPEEDVAGLKRNQEKLLREKKALEGKMGDFDLDEWNKLKDEKAKREQIEAEKKGEFDKLRAKIEADSQKAIQEREARAAKLQANLYVALVRGDAARAIAAAKGNADLLLPHIESAVEVVEDGESFVPRVKDAKNGGHRFGKGTEYMTIPELVNEFKEKFPQAFEGVNANGSGANGRTGGAGDNRSLKDMSAEQRLAFALKQARPA